MAVADPTITYWLVRRLPNGNNVELGQWVVTDIDNQLALEQEARAAALAQADFERINNPAWRVLLYGPTNGGDYTDDDLIWDSLTN